MVKHASSATLMSCETLHVQIVCLECDISLDVTMYKKEFDDTGNGLEMLDVFHLIVHDVRTDEICPQKSKKHLI